MRLSRIGSLPILILAAACAAGAARAAGGPSAAAATRRELSEVLSRVPNPVHGRELFRTCTVCHGAHDAGLPVGWVPEIAGQHARVIAKQLVDYRHGARWDLRMEIVAGRHNLKTVQDIADVASYVASLPPAVVPPTGSGADVSLGRSLYRAGCDDCHGRAGEGSNARFVPRLAGQQYDYLVRQLHDAVDGRRPNLGTMHARALRHFGASELDALADYLSRLPPRSDEIPVRMP